MTNSAVPSHITADQARQLTLSNETASNDFTNLAMQELALPAANPLTYTGPREVLLNQAVALSGTYDPKRITQVTLTAEDKHPVPVTLNHTKGEWRVNLTGGFRSQGARWLRLKGMDRSGKVIKSQIVYLTVSTSPLTIGQGLSLKVLKTTVFKTFPYDANRLNAQQKATVAAGQTLEVKRYGYIDGHLKVELAQAIAPVGHFGYFFDEYVQLSKGSQVLVFSLEDVPDIPLQAQFIVAETTQLKATIADASTLSVNQQVKLLQGQTFAITGYACIRGHFRVRLAQPIPGFGSTGYVYWKSIQIKKGSQVIAYDPDALTVKALTGTIFKKRPVDSSKLSSAERFNFIAGNIYGVSSYALEDGHLKLSLTEELPKFGNTGYVFPGYVEMRRGNKAFNPAPPRAEISVPYFSQRDNPRSPGSTCNVTSIAMVMYYHGVRSRGGGQLEDELLQWCLNKGGPGCQTDNNILNQLLKAYGFEASFATTRQWSEVKNELTNRRPVVLGGDFTASGHIICVIGFNSAGYIVNDPWGDALTGYTDTEGRKLIYPYSYMDRVAGPNGSVWAHFIRKK